MGKPVTLLERLCAHCLSFGAQCLEVEYKDRREWVSTLIDGAPTGIADWPDSGSEATELRHDLLAVARKPVRTVVNGKVWILRVRTCNSISGNGPGENDSGDAKYEVAIESAPPPDPSAVPRFTAKQGQYLAFIDSYIRINRRSPAESDMERYFRVSPPSINGMVKTLERNGLIERSPGQGRSIRLLVKREHLPPLE